MIKGDTMRPTIEVSGRSAGAGGEVDVAAPAPKVKETRERALHPGAESGEQLGCRPAGLHSCTALARM